MTANVWHDPRFTATTCWTCGATVGDPCVVPGTVFPEQMIEPVPHAKRIEKMIDDEVISAADAGPFPYTEYIKSLANGEPA